MRYAQLSKSTISRKLSKSPKFGSHGLWSMCRGSRPPASAERAGVNASKLLSTHYLLTHEAQFRPVLRSCGKQVLKVFFHLSVACGPFWERCSESRRRAWSEACQLWTSFGLASSIRLGLCSPQPSHTITMSNTGHMISTGQPGQLPGLHAGRHGAVRHFWRVSWRSQCGNVRQQKKCCMTSGRMRSLGRKVPVSACC